MPQHFGARAVCVAVPSELLDAAALLRHLTLSPAELKKIRYFRHRMYRRFALAKKQGRERVIDAPDERLKLLQRKIAPLLDRLYDVRQPVHGFIVGKSVKTNASAHLRGRFIINVDLKDFFPSITESRVVGMLTAIGVDSAAAKIVGILCCLGQRLPQGAPTSPVLSNMICFRMDRQLLAFAKGARCIYTRYADDITFSSHQPPVTVFAGQVPPSGRLSPDLLSPDLLGIYAANGFALNPSKLYYADRYSRRTVTGLKVNELLNVDRRFVRNLRAAIHSVETSGLENAQAKFRDRHGGTSDLGAHLEGKISWLRHVRGQTDPVFRAIAVRFSASFPDRAIAVLPSAAEVRDRAVWIVEHFEGEMSQGTAFFLRGVGLVTAAHCVAGVEEAEVYHPSKRSNAFKVRVAERDGHRDLAVLAHDIPATEYFELERSNRSVAVGDDLTAAGYPDFGPGDGLNVREGKVSSLPVKSLVKLVEVTQKLTQGMSGGPLLDADGAVVGVIHKGGPREGRDFGVRIDELNAWLAM